MGVPDEPAKARIELELVLGANPIRGAIGDSAGSEVEFSGWLELLGALERIRSPKAPQAKEQPDPDGERG